MPTGPVLSWPTVGIFYLISPSGSPCKARPRCRIDEAHAHLVPSALLPPSRRPPSCPQGVHPGCDADLCGGGLGRWSLTGCGVCTSSAFPTADTTSRYTAPRGRYASSRYYDCQSRLIAGCGWPWACRACYYMGDAPGIKQLSCQTVALGPNNCCPLPQDMKSQTERTWQTGR